MGKNGAKVLKLQKIVSIFQPCEDGFTLNPQGQCEK